MMSDGKSKPKRSLSSSSSRLAFLGLSPKIWILQTILCGTCVCMGFLAGINFRLSACSAHILDNENQAMNAMPLTPVSNDAECDAKYQPIIQKREIQLKQQCQDYFKSGNLTKAGNRRFPLNMKETMSGMSFVDRDEFNKRFDSGVPLDPSSPTNDKVLLLYSHETSLPSDLNVKKAARESGEPPTLNVFHAVANCDYLNVIFVQTQRAKQCTAVMGQYANFHIMKWMRLPNAAGGDYGPLNSKVPLQLVNRGAQPSGRKSFRVPTLDDTSKYWTLLKTYLDTLPTVLDELKPIAAQVAKQNTVVVMLANHGQSELLMNFVCAARSRNLDLSSVLVFPTDQETKDLADGMGLTTFFDKTNYGNAPTQAAGRYGDKTFTAMMFAKVYCVQMVTMLGYDVLFQDIDIVWFRDPLPYFQNKNSPSHNFDIYFQDDGNRALFYAPYSANTGFYYIRGSEVTQYFFNSLLMSGDLIYATNSHQIALIATLSEFASRYGMKVKVLSRDTDEFPGGHAYHNRPEFMREIFQGKAKPYLFHMSWTENKYNKKLYFRQIGEWYVRDKCIGKTAQSILGDGGGAVAQGSLVSACCSAKAMFSCHYRDKPSKEPCPNAPLIDPVMGKPFW